MRALHWHQAPEGLRAALQLEEGYKPARPRPGNTLLQFTCKVPTNALTCSSSGASATATMGLS